MTFTGKIVFFFLVTAAATQSYIMKIEPFTMECFHEILDKGDTLKVGFEVTEGGFLDLDMTLTDPNAKVLRRINHQSRDLFTLRNVSLNGNYNYCLNNGMSSLTPKTVYFFVTAERAYEIISENVSDVSLEVNKLLSDLQTVRLDQWNMLARMKIRQKLILDTRSRVGAWLWIQMLFSIIVTIMQVRYLKKLFEENFIV